MQYIYWGIQFLNYLTFLWLDISNHYANVSSGIKFFSIILCFLYALLGKTKKRSVYIVAGLFFTVVSDYCLLLTDFYTIGMLSFSVVQTIYSRYCSKSWRQFAVKTIGNVVLIVGVLVFSNGILRVHIDCVFLLSVYYFVHLVSNVICSFRRHLHERGDKERKIFAYGMLLFFLCDIHVAIFNASDYLAVGQVPVYQILFKVASVAMWFYYLPSQILIAYSDKKW